MSTLDIAMDAGFGALNLGMGGRTLAKEATARAAAKAGGEVGAKTGVRMLAGAAKAVTIAGAVMFVAEGSGYVADAIAGAVYAANGEDFAEVKRDMMTDEDRGVNVVSAGLDGLADGADAVCLGLADTLHENVAEPVGEFVSQIPLIGGPLCAVGGGLEWIGGVFAEMPGAALDGIKEVSNVIGMGTVGAKPIERNSVLREDEKAREEVEEKLRAMEADGFAAEGTTDALLKSRDEFRGTVSCGYDQVLADMEGISKLYDDWKAGTPDEALADWKPEDGPVFDEAMFRAVDTAPYSQGMTDEMSASLWAFATDTGLASGDAADDEYAVLPSSEVAALQEAVDSGEMTYAESGAYLAAYLDHYGVFDDESMQEILYYEGFYDAVDASAEAGAEMGVEYPRPANEAELAAALAQATAEGAGQDGPADETTAAQGVADAEEQLTTDEAIQYLQLADSLGFLEEGVLEHIDEQVAAGYATYADYAGNVAMIAGDEIDAMLDQLAAAESGAQHGAGGQENSQSAAHDEMEMV